MSRERRERLFPWLVGAAGIALMFHGALFSAGRLLPGTREDARLNIYILEHSYRWLLGSQGHRSLWNLPAFFPAGNTAAYSDLLLGVAPLYWSWRGLGVSPETAFLAFLLAASALNFAACFLLLRRAFDFPARASAAGAFLFAFGSARVGQLEHAQLIPHFFTVVALFGAVRAFQQPSRGARWLGLACLGLVGQFYTAFYPTWFLLFGGALFAAWALVPRKPRTEAIAAGRRLWKPAAAWTAAALLLCAPLAARYAQAARELGLRPYGAIVSWIPFPQSWLYMGWGSWLYGGMTRWELFRYLPMIREHALGLGFATLACCAVGLYAERRRVWTPPLALAAASLVVLCTQFPAALGPVRPADAGGPMGAAMLASWSPWMLVHALLPGAAALRAITRVSVFLLLPASIAAAAFFSRKWTPAVGLLALLCAAEQVWSVQPAFDRASARGRAAAVAAEIPASCAAFFAARETATAERAPWPEVQLDAMWAGLERGIPTANGYSGNFPPGYDALNEAVIRGPKDEARLRAALKDWESREGLAQGTICFVKAGGKR